MQQTNGSPTRVSLKEAIARMVLEIQACYPCLGNVPVVVEVRSTCNYGYLGAKRLAAGPVITKSRNTNNL